MTEWREGLKKVQYCVTSLMNDPLTILFFSFQGRLVTTMSREELDLASGPDDAVSTISKKNYPPARETCCQKIARNYAKAQNIFSCI